MEELNKLKVNIGDVCIELEGNRDFVIDIFSDIWQNGFGKISSYQRCQTNYSNNEDTKELPKDSVDTNNLDKQTNDFETSTALPELNDIVMKDIVKTESDWVVVYAYYQSEKGSKTFTIEDLRAKYHETNRYTENRNKKFSSNIKKIVTVNYISAVNKTDYKMTTDGSKYAKKIIFSKEESKSNKRKSGAKTYTSQSFNIVDLTLTEEQRANFREYYNSFNNPSNMDKTVIIACWLKENLNQEEIDADILFTMLKIANSSTTFDIKASLSNAKTINKYFKAGSEKGKYKLHHIGEDHFNHELLKRNK